MAYASDRLVVVFPISASAFGLRADWFETFAPKLIRPSFLLVTLLLIVSVGIMALRRFENVDFGRKAWGLPLLLVALTFWPSLVIGLKDLVDTFNTFLVNDIFRIPWHGFGFPDLGSVRGWIGLPAEGLARLLPNLAYWIIYAFYMVFFFFYAVLGPLTLAKGILFDEMQAFLDLVKEVANLLMWQTTLVVLVGFIMPDIVSGKPFPAHPQANFYFLSVILGVMIFFIPSLARKFESHVEGAFVPMGFKWGGALFALTAAGKLGATALSSIGASSRGLEHLKPWTERALGAEEFGSRYQHRTHIRDLEHEKQVLEDQKHEEHTHDHAAHENVEKEEDQEKMSLLELSRKAKKETEPVDDPHLGGAT